jgi:hypothetical protein
MSGVRAPYAVERGARTQAAHASGQHNRRKRQQEAIALAGTQHAAGKKAKRDPGVPMLAGLKRKLDNRMAAVAARDTRHTRKPTHNDTKHAALGARHAATGSQAPDTGSVNSTVSRRWYYKELKQVIERSDILLEVSRRVSISTAGTACSPALSSRAHCRRAARARFAVEAVMQQAASPCRSQSSSRAKSIASIHSVCAA